MKNIFKLCVFPLLLITTNSFAWEVTTHETVTKIAVTGDQRAENLKHFVETFGLSDEDYSKEGNAEFYFADGLSSDIKLSGTYINIIKDITDPKITKENLVVDESIFNGSYVNLMQAGAILEDTQMKPSIQHARFNRHFYDPSKAGDCYGMNLSIVKATCAKIWALEGDEDPNMNYNLSKVGNDFSWRKIVGTKNERGYILDSIIGKTTSSRKAAQANLFVSLGFLSHLMEDMTQAAHVRNDAHAGAWKPGGVNVFEVWANKNFSAESQEPVSFAAAKAAPVFNPTSFDNLFTSTATWTNKNFFSDDTTPGDILDDHVSPENSTQQETILTQYFGHNYYFLKSKGLDIDDGTKLLFFIDQIGPKNEHALTYIVPENLDIKYDVLKDNAKLVFPKAVSAVEGMVNYIFRGKIYTYIDPNDSDKLIIKNTTNQNEIANGLDTAFKVGTKIYLYYENKDGERLPLPEIGEKFISDFGKSSFSNGDSISISGLSDALSQVDLNDDRTIIVALEGQMGGNGIGERSIAASKLVFKNNASLLLSFDDSGSMRSKIEDAKNSALNILPLFKDATDSYIEIQAFNRTGIDFSSDLDAVSSKVKSIYAYGGTPLYESIISAANSASIEATNHSSNKVIIVLYTDGIADTDDRKQSAIDAISKVKHPEIDEVYLVFINTGDISGKGYLEDVALKSNRKFIYLNSVDQLANELQKVLQ